MNFLSFLFLILIVSSQAKVVLIDPGHGGEESGAVGKLDEKGTRKIFEKDLSLRLAKKIKEELSKHTTTYLTRSLDRLVSLQEVAQLCAFLCTDAASGMTGQTIYVDAGCHAVD
jgi:NAD(P)-dependent dehydrogenase (short-subunit alcohol dehydrogenase family)